MDKCNVSELFGKILIDITISDDKDEILFECSDGTKYKMYHNQDCWENVSVEDVIGDIDDLKGVPLILAEESTSDKNPVDVKKEHQNSFTWTFYRFATNKGHVDIRWYGESNGYYSEGVDFMEVKS